MLEVVQDTKTKPLGTQGLERNGFSVRGTVVMMRIRPRFCLSLMSEMLCD